MTRPRWMPASVPAETQQLLVEGIPPTVSPSIAAVCRSRMDRAVRDLLAQSQLTDVAITIRSVTSDVSAHVMSDLAPAGEHELPTAQRALQYQASEPLWALDHLIVSADVRETLFTAVALLQHEHQVFDQWGLRAIEPFPRTALNFHGEPGTGKTLAAHGIAKHIRRKILVASYAQIESMYHGEGPKNVEALFAAAERDMAVLFIDEADSLLSSRLTQVTQASEQAINSMRSQLLISLERFRGLVIFATNLVSNYDRAFDTRVQHIHFPLPDLEARIAIWKAHLPAALPTSTDVDPLQLASAIDHVCGRDIKNAVITAAVRAANLGQPYITQEDLIMMLTRIVEARNAIRISNIPKVNTPFPSSVMSSIEEALPEQDEPDNDALDEFEWEAV